MWSSASVNYLVRSLLVSVYARVCETRSGYYAVGLHLAMLEIGLNEFWPSVRCSSVDLQKVEIYTELTQIGGELCFAVKLGQFVKLPYRRDVFSN